MRHSALRMFGGFALAIWAFAPLGKAAISDQLVVTTADGDIVTITPGGGVVVNACPVGTCLVTASTDTATEIDASGTLGNYSLLVDLGIDSLGLTAPAIMDLTINNAKEIGGSSGHLTIAYTETGMTQTYVGFSGTGGGTQDGSSVTYNVLDGSTQIGTTGAMSNSSPGPGSGATFSGSLSTSSGASGAYSLTQQVVLAFSASGEDDSGDFHLSSVPEPTSISLLGGILALTAGAIRRKVRKA